MAGERRKGGLGRGLSALMSDVNEVSAVQAASEPGITPNLVPIELINPNPDQPRRTFDEVALQELSDSIREKGVIQPLIVRKDPNKADSYQIVAGERRWRASQKAGLHELPVVIREFNDTEVLEIAIIENIQRSDLNPVDEAQGYHQLMDRFGHTQEQMATALGKSRSHIANSMRLLSLSDDIQDLLATGKLSAGHARTLIGRENASELAAAIISKGLSVREAEKLTKKKPQAKTRAKPAKDADTVAIEGELSAHLKMPVKINHTSGSESGTLAINYKDLDQLDDLLRILSGS